MKDIKLEFLISEIKKSQQGNKLLIVTDRNVEKFYIRHIENLFKNSKIETQSIIFEPEEELKSWQNVMKILSILENKNFSKADGIVAFGGGTIGDISGFVASIYMRGIKLYHIPTTLLAMVDSSIGGKTGINTLKGKNQIGSFYSAYFRVLETEFLKTLDEREFRSGMAEVIKYAFLQSTIIKEVEQYFNGNKFLGKNDFNFFKESLDFLKNINLVDILESFNFNEDEICFDDIKFNAPSEEISLNSEAFLFNEINNSTFTIINKCIEVCSIMKRLVVKLDNKDDGIRKILNFGHTIGHSLEKSFDYKITHGEAVAMGMKVETLIGMRMKISSKETFIKLSQILQNFKLGNESFLNLENEEFKNKIINNINSDKKINGQDIDLIIPVKNNKVIIKCIEIKEVKEILMEILN